MTTTAANPFSDNITQSDRTLISAYFEAMQAGKSAEEQLFGIFADDARYTEPFSGAPTEHVGLAAIRATFRKSWENPLPDVRIVLERVDVVDGRIRSQWVCHTPAFPKPMRGEDRYLLKEGKIAQLEVNILGPVEDLAPTEKPNAGWERPARGA